MSYAELLRDLSKYTDKTDGAGSSSIDAEFMCRSLLNQDTILSALAIAAAVEQLKAEDAAQEFTSAGGNYMQTPTLRDVERRAAELRKGAK